MGLQEMTVLPFVRVWGTKHFRPVEKGKFRTHCFESIFTNYIQKAQHKNVVRLKTHDDCAVAIWKNRKSLVMYHRKFHKFASASSGRMAVR